MSLPSDDNEKVTHCQSADAFFDLLRPKVPGLGLVKPFYRGQGDSRYKLVPGALRGVNELPRMPASRKGVANDHTAWTEAHKFDRRKLNFPFSSPARVAFREAELLKFFVEACDRGGIAIPGESKAWRARLASIKQESDVATLEEWPLQEHHAVWAVAQHHGLPTRLLDWSRSPLVASYFAASSCLTNQDLPSMLAVWTMQSGALDPRHVQVVEVAPVHSRNLTAQAGVFTLTITTAADLKSKVPVFPLSIDALAVTATSSPATLDPVPALRKYTLDRAHAADLLELCEDYGVSGATMFPGLDGACRQALEKRARISAQHGQKTLAETMSQVRKPEE